MESKRLYILILLIGIFFSNNANAVGDSILHPEVYRYTINSTLEKTVSVIEAFNEELEKNHEISKRFYHKNSRLNGLEGIRDITARYQIDKIYYTYIYVVKKYSLFEFFCKNDKDVQKPVIIKISFSFFPDEDEINYEKHFQEFILEFEEYSKKNRLGLTRIE